jgi:hypothetical protein
MVRHLLLVLCVVALAGCQLYWIADHHACVKRAAHGRTEVGERRS